MITHEKMNEKEQCFEYVWVWVLTTCTCGSHLLVYHYYICFVFNEHTKKFVLWAAPISLHYTQIFILIIIAHSKLKMNLKVSV